MAEKIAGLEGVLNRLSTISGGAKEALSRAVYESAVEVEKLSRDLTPYLTGALEGSHLTHQPEFQGDDVTCEITVGGPAAPYAIYVHENLDAHHPHGQAKFLSSAVLAFKDEYPQNVARRFYEYLKEFEA